MHRSRALARLLAGCAIAAIAAAQNRPPATPVITEPQATTPVNPYDLHMETAPFSDPDPGDTHVATDWEVWTVAPSGLVWAAHGVTGPERLHAHLGDGVFQGSHAGWSRLFESTQFVLRVRHQDSSGDPLTQWSPWASRPFTTTALGQVQPMLLDDISSAPVPRFVDGAGLPVELPTGATNPSVTVETSSGQLLLRIVGSALPGNVLINPPPLAQHEPVRVVVHAGSTGGNLVLPETELSFSEHGGCQTLSVLLPALTLPPGQSAWFWVNRFGATYRGTAGQTAPVFTTRARNLQPPYVVLAPGFSLDVVAADLRMPVNVAFKPGAGPAPGDPKFYVTELYGSIRTVCNDGSVLVYATNLLNYTPSGQFPGSGEQGLTGIAVDPATGDVFAAMLHRVSGQNHPRIVRFTSNDGGRTAATQTVILDMPGETQGQSHQISALEIVDGLLHAHMGDGFVASTARSLSSFRGKILRLHLDGSPVASNPYNNGPPINARDYVYALGVRNPFGGAWRAADGARYMVENGPSIDRFAKIVAGRDYLWAGADSHMLNFALFNWNPATGPVNLAFVQPETFGGSGFPAAMMGHAFVTESGPTYAEGQQGTGKRITEWVLDGSGNRLAGPIPFVEYVGDGRGSVIGLAAGPDGLYFTDFYRDLNTSGPTAVGGRVIRIRYGSMLDCDANGLSDWCEIAIGSAPDCNRNGVIDSCDIAAGTSTDFDRNGIPDECDLLAASTDRVSAQLGGQVDFALRPGTAHVGRIYVLLGSLSGTVPGLLLGGVTLPLNNDFWFAATLDGLNSPWFQHTFGVLAASGEASATLLTPVNTPAALVGFVAHHAYAVYDQATAAFVLASNAVPLRIEP